MSGRRRPVRTQDSKTESPGGRPVGLAAARLFRDTGTNARHKSGTGRQHVSMYPSTNRISLVGTVIVLAFSTVAGIGGAAAPQPPATQQGGAPKPQQPASQQPPITFTTNVNAVQVDAIVIDKMGRFVSDLRADEFEVLEDGKPQTVSGFSMVNVATNRDLPPVQAGRPIQVDTQSNDRGFDGRLYLIVLDDLHITALRSNAARVIAKQFIEKNVAPGDLAAVITTSGARSAAQGFTSNRALLLQVVQRCVGRKVISPALAGLSMDGTPEAANPEAAKPERMFNARSSLETLSQMAAYAATVRNRRKAMVLIGEGIDYQFGSQDDESRELRDQYRSFVGAANRANLIVYSFDPRVYTQGGDDMVDVASTPPGDMEAGQEKLKTTALQDTLRASQDNLRALSVETGGFAVVASRGFLGAFDRIKVENSNYYMLGYTPTNQAQDGKYREIEVRVKRTGLVVQARKGYTALSSSRLAAPLSVDAKSGTSAVLRNALVSPLPVTGFTIRAAAIPFQGTTAKASVLVLVQASGRDLLFAPSGGDKLMDSVELAIVAVDVNGKTAGGERVLVDMPLSPRMQKFVAQTGMVFQVRLDVPPGSYQLRIAGRDMGSGTVGSVLYDLDVPDFFGTPLSMSGIVLSGEEAGMVPSPKPDAMLDKLLPGTPVTQRVFSTTDIITALAEVYDNQRGQAHTVYIATSVAAEDGRVLYREEASRPTAELKGARGAFGHTVKIPLRDLGVGSFVLKIEARSSLGTTTVVSRELPFRIR